MKPEELFCKILQENFDRALTATEAATQVPSKTVRSIRSNIDRVNNIIYNYVKDQLDIIEKFLIEVLNLNNINKLSGVNGWCRTAWSCRNLIETLVTQRSTYLPFISQEIVDQFYTNYNLFDVYVCRLGFKQLIETFSNNVLLELQARLDELSVYMEEQLGLQELVDNYEEILQENNVYDTLNVLRQFLDCAFSTCSYAMASENALVDYEDRLYLVRTDNSWQVNINAALTEYNKKNGEIQAQIDRLRLMCTTQEFNRQIGLDEVVIF